MTDSAEICAARVAELSEALSGWVFRPTCKAVRHGTRTAYQEGCRCPLAREAEMVAKRLHVKRRYLERGPLTTDATGTLRRIHALQRMGWPLHLLDARVGRRKGATANITMHPPAFVFTTTDRKYRQLYDDLSTLPGPSKESARRAALKGYAPPLAWDEDNIDDPASEANYGTEMEPQRAIHMDDVEWLLDTGESAAAIAERLGVQLRGLERAAHRAGRHDLARKVRAA